jgi:hypothetical protein
MSRLLCQLGPKQMLVQAFGGSNRDDNDDAYRPRDRDVGGVNVDVPQREHRRRQGQDSGDYNCYSARPEETSRGADGQVFATDGMAGRNL